MKITIYITIIIVILALGAFVGKTTISENGISMERPFTAVCFVLTCLFGILNK